MPISEDEMRMERDFALRRLLKREQDENTRLLQAEKEVKRLLDENWELKQKNSDLRNYINFKSLGEQFEEWSK